MDLVKVSSQDGDLDDLGNNDWNGEILDMVRDWDGISIQDLGLAFHDNDVKKEVM